MSDAADNELISTSPEHVTGNCGAPVRGKNCMDCALLAQLKSMVREMSSLRVKGRASIASLTDRQREIMHLVVAGHPSKIIAMDLGISQRTVENHRWEIMHRTGTKSLPELSRLVFCANWPVVDEPLG